jgi:hypothetical protein
MGCYQSDGQVLNLGRGDSQVKIRGQRVELGDVESNLRKLSPPDVKSVVEVVKRPAHREILVAFLIGPLDRDRFGSTTCSEASILDHAAASHFTGEMETLVTQHAIPACFISLQKLPMSATGKADRKRLQAIAAELLEARDQDFVSRQQAPPPSEGPGATIAQPWTRTLPIEAVSIGIYDNFFELGGDSIVATQMVDKARAAGISLKVAGILQNPVFADLVAAADQKSGSESEEGAIVAQPQDGNEAELSFA